MYPDSIQRLITELGRLPGVGGRTATRLAFHILRAPKEQAEALSLAIREVRERIGECEVCFDLAEGPRCPICLDPRRDDSILCVVEQSQDVHPIERTGEFRGRYHVLGGALSPMDGVDEEDIHIGELYERLSNGGVKEVVIATNPTTTGEATALYIAAEIGRRWPQTVATRPASGLPVGADLEYADELTLGRAMTGRRTIHP